MRFARSQNWLAMFLLCLSTAAGQKPEARQTEMDRATEEFKKQTAGLGLRAGEQNGKRNGGGPKPVWHGRVFENLRNDFLDAIPHEIRQRGSDKSLLRRNQFGFNLGGPAFIPKLLSGRNTYFSVSYEGMRERISRTYLRTIPTVAERNGDWSATVDQAGRPLAIYDPASTRLNPSYRPAEPVSESNPQYERSLFPGGVMPANRLDPEAKRRMQSYPDPNAAAGPFFANNFFVNSPETNTANGWLAKVDHSLGEKHRVTLDIAISNGTLGAARWFSSEANPGPSDRRFQSRRGSLEHVFTASPSTVNTATFHVSSSTSSTASPVFPVYQFAPYLQMGTSYPVSRNASNTYVWTDALSSRRGKHSLRGVVQYATYQVNTYWPQYPSGSYRFSPGLTSLPGVVNTGHAFASYMLGLAEYAEASLVLSPSYFRRNAVHASFRDQYEAAKGLTISLGISVDRYSPRTEKYDRQSTIDLEAINPANGRKGALVAAARNGKGRAFQPMLTRLSPSLSIVWNPRGTSKTVVRASFSRSYSPIPLYSS
ncbi:MAG: hypothetical protein ABIZ80_23570, partial [Bryobacteraceae bacterium]